MADASSPAASLRQLLLEIGYLDSSLALLNWDQETYLPQGGAAARAATISALSARRHALATDITLQREVEHLQSLPAGALDEAETALLREVVRDLARYVKLPNTFVAQLAEATSRGQVVWQAARQADDFSQFAPLLEEIVQLSRQEADYLGYAASPYDALLDTYEPGLTAASLTALFTPLAAELQAMVPSLAARSASPLAEGTFPVEEQLAFGREMAAGLGYNLQAGRLDLSAHPFSTSFHPTDARITTRVDLHDIWVCLGSVIHETGHALYEQGLPVEHFATPLGQAASVGIHESQSRSFENIIGRSRAFWEFWYPKLQARFPDPFARTELDQFLARLTNVTPSFIRVEADEVTYNLHIILRTELERELIEGTLRVRDLPEAWNAKVKQYLGLDVPTPSLGVLQDVHWSCGYFGYFPTYALGNLYAAQFWAAVKRELPDIEESLRQGDASPFLGWMREHVHRYGRQYLPSELLERATGETLNPQYFTRYLSERYGTGSSTG